MLSKHKKSLQESGTEGTPLQMTDAQTERLLRHPSSENPLWLTVACEQLTRYETPESIESHIDSLPDGVLKYVSRAWCKTIVTCFVK